MAPAGAARDSQGTSAGGTMRGVSGRPDEVDRPRPATRDQLLARARRDVPRHRQPYSPVSGRGGNRSGASHGTRPLRRPPGAAAAAHRG